jgi:hypothetical protein
LIAGTIFFKNLIFASGFESLKDSVVEGRVATGLKQEADFSKLIISLLRNKNIEIYEIITQTIFLTFWANGISFLIVGTTFFKNLIFASWFEPLKHSKVGFIFLKN